MKTTKKRSPKETPVLRREFKKAMTEMHDRFARMQTDMDDRFARMKADMRDGFDDAKRHAGILFEDLKKVIRDMFDGVPDPSRKIEDHEERISVVERDVSLLKGDSPRR